MNDALPPPSPPQKPAAGLGPVIAGATIVLLAAIGAASFVMLQELRALRDAEPVAPTEVTQALTALQSALDKQRSDHADQLARLEEDLAALKTQQAAPAPDLEAQLAPMQMQLDAIAAKLEEERTAPAAEPTAAPVATDTSAEATPTIAPALREAVASGEPYSDALASAGDQLPEPSYHVLAAHAADGIATDDELHRQFGMLLESHPAPSEAGDVPVDDQSWAGRANRMFGGLVKIKRTAAPSAAVADPYATLREHASLSLDQLLNRLQALPASEQAPFEGWIADAQANREVRRALDGN